MYSLVELTQPKKEIFVKTLYYAETCRVQNALNKETLKRRAKVFLEDRNTIQINRTHNPCSNCLNYH